MIACLLNPASCIPEWVTFIATYWDRLLLVLLVGVVAGGIGGWKLMVAAILGLIGLVALRKGGIDPAWDNGGDDPPKKRKQSVPKRPTLQDLFKRMSDRS